jgi:uncharacterized membrane protein HdeD (DUF308 family)
VPVGSGHWWALALRSAIAIPFGLAALVRPDIALEALILLFGAYALAGLIAFLMPGLTAILLLYLIAAWVIVTGISEKAMAIRLRKEIRGEWAMIVGDALCVLFGVILAVVGSAVGLLSLIVLLGINAMAVGGLLLTTAFRVRKHREVETAG